MLTLAPYKVVFSSYHTICIKLMRASTSESVAVLGCGTAFDFIRKICAV